MHCHTNAQLENARGSGWRTARPTHILHIVELCGSVTSDNIGTDIRKLIMSFFCSASHSLCFMSTQPPQWQKRPQHRWRLKNHAAVCLYIFHAMFLFSTLISDATFFCSLYYSISRNRVALCLCMSILLCHFVFTHSFCCCYSFVLFQIWYRNNCIIIAYGCIKQVMFCPFYLVVLFVLWTAHELCSSSLLEAAIRLTQFKTNG